MKNPFDPIKEESKFLFFDQMVQGIDNWITNKYPDFDRKLLDKISEISRLQNEFKLVINDYEKDSRNSKKKEIESFKDDLNSFMKQNYPDISSELIKKYDQLNKTIRNFKKKEQEIDKKMKELAEREKNLVKSESIYEDVYKMRDEFKKMKEMVEKMSKNIKKAFEL